MLKSLASKYKTVPILGLTKNAGKTTFLNWLLEQAPETDLALAVTSSGRDGEEKDLVTGLPKPRIFLRKGMLVTTAEELYPLCEGKLEILRETTITQPVMMRLLGSLAPTWANPASSTAMISTSP